MRQKPSLKKAPDSPIDQLFFCDEIHRQAFNFISQAKKFYVSSLLKRQLSILIELSPNDISYPTSLKTKFVANFNKKSSRLASQRIPFMLLYFMSNATNGLFLMESSYKLDRSDEKSEKELIEVPVLEKVMKEERNEKKRSEVENKQLMDFFYLLLDGCVKIFEVFFFI
jgi:hypothetical protein